MLVGVSDNDKCVNDAMVSVCMCRCVCVCVCHCSCSVISDVREKNEKGKLFLTLEDELKKLDPIGNSIRVTGDQIYADRVNSQPEKEQVPGYLDL